MDKIKLAQKGESRACSFLKRQGFKILERNFRTRFAEIDIVAKDKETICFVEVKTRSGNDFGLPQDSLTKNKINHISKAALFYLKKKNLSDVPCRFDVVSIIDDLRESKIDLIKDAFCLSEKYSY